jgi:hypothetical protein
LIFLFQALGRRISLVPYLIGEKLCSLNQASYFLCFLHFRQQQQQFAAAWSAWQAQAQQQQQP